MSLDRIIGALLAASGGKIEVPIGVYEQISYYPVIRTWRRESDGTFVWALDEPGMQEIQEREQEAYELARANQRQEDLAGAVDALTTKLLQEYRALPLDASYMAGIERGVDFMRTAAGLGPAPAGGPRGADIAVSGSQAGMVPNR